VRKVRRGRKEGAGFSIVDTGCWILDVCQRRRTRAINCGAKFIRRPYGGILK